MRRVFRIPASVGVGFRHEKPRLRKWLEIARIRLSRYFVEAFEPSSDEEAARIRAMTGGVGAPILLPSALVVSQAHRVVREQAESKQRYSRPPRRKYVLVLSTDSKTYGGIQRYAQAWSQALYELGFAPRTIALWPNGVREKPLGISRRARFAVTCFLTALVRRPSAVICTHIGLSPVAMILKRAFSIPYAVSLHGDDSWGYPRNPMVEAALRNADLLASVSHFTRDVVCAKSGIPKSRTYVTGSVLSPEIEFHCALTEPASYYESLRAIYGKNLAHEQNSSSATTLPILARAVETSLAGEKESGLPGRQGNPLVLTVARLDANAPYKRHDLVIRAVSALRSKYPGLRYCVVGDGSYRSHLEALTKEAGVSDAVEFTGKVPESQLATLYKSASYFVMPSRISLDPPEGEGFGLVYLEAGVWGLPSVAARGGGASETVLDGETGLLAEPDSLESLIEKMDTLLSDTALRERLSRQAKVRALEFSYPRFRRRCSAVMAALEAAEKRGCENSNDTPMLEPRAAAVSIEPEYPRDSLFPAVSSSPLPQTYPSQTDKNLYSSPEPGRDCHKSSDIYPKNEAGLPDPVL